MARRRRKNTWNKTDAWDTDHKMLTRSKIKVNKKSVSFVDASVDSKICDGTRSPAARSLFSMRCILELPNELVTQIMRYFNSKELMLLRCVWDHFAKNQQDLELWINTVCQDFAYIIDNNRSIWSNASYQNMWPTSHSAKQLFKRGADANNKECLIKLGLAHLYHFNLIVEAEKTEKEVRRNALLAAQYFKILDNNISPNKPLTWMLIRPPWSNSIKMICLKQAIFNQLVKTKISDVGDATSYNIMRIQELDQNGDTKSFVADHTSSKFSHTVYERLLQQKSSSNNDTGVKLQWLRDLHDCAMSGNLEASFQLAHYFISNNYQDFVSQSKALEFCVNLFQNSYSLRNDKLEQSQPKINSLMRCILVDWLGEVAYMKAMSHQVLHAAVQYIDRFLTSRVIERTKLQLLGITCLLLAAKSHYDTRHVHILTVRESSWLTDTTYQYEDVVKMLGEVIGTFKGDLWPPTSWDYLDLLLAHFEMDNSTKCMAHYIHDMSLQYNCFGGYKPSTLACATLMLVHITQNQDDVWSEKYIDITGFQVKDLANCVSLLFFKCFGSTPIKDDRDLPLKSIKEEYSSEKYSFVATKMILPTSVELKNRILSADSMLSCVSQEPFQFVVLLPDFDDTLNMSTKSIDYDGDCEDYEMNSDSSSDEESFYVGRSRLSSYRSVDDFTDDDTTMDTEAFNLAAMKWNNSPQDDMYDGSYDMDLKKDNISKLEKTDNKFRFPLEAPSSIQFNEEKSDARSGKRRRLKRKVKCRSGYLYRKRTRSNVSEHSR